MLADQRILVGVTGSIAAYKACDLVQRLREKGASVRVTMTQSATRLVQPETFASLTGAPVTVDPWADAAQGDISHINNARWATVFLIAPCTAHTLAELANGLTGSSVSMTALAYSGIVMVAPAMNTVMLNAPATQHNLRTLAARGVHCLPTLNGTLACGEEGEGKLLTPEEIVDYVESVLALPQPIPNLSGKKITISGGHTEEALDGVRFLSNRSSGKTALVLARAFRLAGAKVKLILGRIDGEMPSGFAIDKVRTSEEFHRCLLENQKDADAIIMAAAIADFVPVQADSGKWKHSNALKNIELKPSPQILRELGHRKRADQLLIGFALETENAIGYAWEKLKDRNCDFVVANNPLSQPDLGFGKDQVEALILDATMPPKGDERLIRMTKYELAGDLVGRVASKLASRGPI